MATRNGPARGADNRTETYLQSATLGGGRAGQGVFRWLGHLHLGLLLGRQALYESNSFGGDPVRMAGPYVASYDREPGRPAVRPSSEERLHGRLIPHIRIRAANYRTKGPGAAVRGGKKRER